MKYPARPDLLTRAVPTPRALDSSPHSMLVLRARASPWISSASAHISTDRQSYVQVADSVPHVVGVRLIGEPGEEHPQVEILGPDVGMIRVISEGDWRIGRQAMLIGDEWCFVRSIEMLSQTRARARDLLRGQWGTTWREWPRGTQGFLADTRLLTPITDPSIRLGTTIWLKTQPRASNVVSLAACPAIECHLPLPQARRNGRGESPLQVSPCRFLLAQTPAEGTLQVFLNGVLLRPGSRGSYRLSGAEITMHAPPGEGAWVSCWYDTQD